MKAGMHTYLVQDPKDDSYTMHTTICDFRTEQPPLSKFKTFIVNLHIF